MIALLFSWVIILSVFFTFGLAFLQCYNKIAKKGKVYSALDTILIGMCVTASVIAIFSLWIPANTMFLFALVFMCIIYWILNNKNIYPLANRVLDFIGGQPKAHLFIYAILVISIAMFCTLHPMMTDTLYYHYQNIMWNDQYSVVPGLANLQPRFAFNSSYFLLASTFGLKPLFGQYIFGVHTFFLAAIFTWVVYKVLNSKNIVVGVIALIMMTCFFVIYKLHITSVTTDFIPNLLICYLIIKLFFSRTAIEDNPVLYFMLPIFIITLKISCFAIILFPLYILYRAIRHKQYIDTSLLIVAGLFIVVPWVTRTVILSGYLIFPFPYIDIFSFDWKIPVEYAYEQKNFIQSFARYPNNIDIDSVLAMPITEWFPVWWDSDMYYYNSIANRFFFVATILTIPLGSFFIIKQKIWKSEFELALAWIATVIGIVVWFINAPDFRFIYSLILAQFFIVILLITKQFDLNKILLTKFKDFNFAIVIVIITIIFVALFSGRWVYYQKGEDVLLSNLVKVPTSMEYVRNEHNLPPIDSLYFVTVNGIKINRMSPSERDVLCLDYELPCSADYVGGIEMRGETLQDGFRCNPNAPHRLTY